MLSAMLCVAMVCRVLVATYLSLQMKRSVTILTTKMWRFCWMMKCSSLDLVSMGKGASYTFFCIFVKVGGGGGGSAKVFSF